MSSSSTSKSDEAVGASMEMELANSFQNINLLEGGEGANRMDWISKMEASRTHAAKEERRARRAAWTEETGKVILERQLFQESGTAKLFPELVWAQILNKLEDPKDKSMLSKMSPLWRDLLKKDMTTFLFNEVLAVFHVDGPPSKNAILECRAVSQEWNKSIDNFAQNFVDYCPIRQVLEFRPSTTFHFKDVLGRIDFPVSPLLVFKFLEWSQSASSPAYGNPFPSRKLKLSISPHCPESSEAFLWEMEQLLTQWGEEVWTIIFIFPRSDIITSIGAYGLSRELLVLMPNLRHLEILFQQRQYQLEETNQLKTYMREHPLPELPHMKSLVTAQAPSLMRKLMMEKFGPTLDTYIDHWEKGCVYEEAQLPNVKLVSLELSHVSPLQMNWPSIQDMDLKCADIVATELPNLFLNLGGIGGTLLKLNLLLLNGDGSPSPIKLEPAAIKKLSLELPRPGNLKTIDFILPMTKLRSLSLTYVKHLKVGKKVAKKRGNDQPDPGSSNEQGVTSSSGRGGDIIQFWQCINRLYESNIWVLFPELRKVHIATFLVEATKSGVDPVTGLGIFSNKEGTTFFKQLLYTREGRKRYFMKRNMAMP